MKLRFLHFIKLETRAQQHLQSFSIGSREIILQNEKKEAGRIQELFASEQVESIHSTEPNLETVFLELTGRRFE